MNDYQFPTKSIHLLHWRSYAYDFEELTNLVGHMKARNIEAIILDGVEPGIEWSLPTDPPAFRDAIHLFIDNKIRTYLGLAAEQLNAFEVSIHEKAWDNAKDFWYGNVLILGKRFTATDRAVNRYFNVTRKYLGKTPLGYMGKKSDLWDSRTDFYIADIAEWP